MEPITTIIKNATVATATELLHCDIGIRDGLIVSLGEVNDENAEVINAAGRLVTPGGVDAHCHMDQPSNDGSVMADDFETATISAACGGTTTVIPFALQMKGSSLDAAVKDYHQSAEGKAVVDYAFHMIVTDPSPDVLEKELPKLVSSGYSHFKIYMTYDDLKLNDYQILEVLALARREGALVMIHAENSDCIAWLTDKLEAAGKIQPQYHATSRPPVVEREATHRAISLAELVDVPVLIVHVSGSESMEQIRIAQNRGHKVFAETCPQYLFLTAKDLETPDFEGAKFVCSPPPRTPEDQEAVWRGLQTGIFQVFSSDHAPFRYADETGKAHAGKGAAFKYIPNGIPGIETRLPLLLSEGVLKGRLDIHKFVSLTSTEPAKLYGLFPRKGTIAPGSDADLVIWDTKTPFTLTNDRLHHNVDYTPYEGMNLTAWPEYVISRGEVVSKAGDFVSTVGRGRFLPSDKRKSGPSVGQWK